MEVRVHARIASNTPGRLRIRLRQRDREATRHVRDQMEHQRGVRHVHADPRTGSVLIRYDEQANTVDGLLDTLHDVGVVLADAAGAITSDVPEFDGHSATAADVNSAFNRLNRRISAATGRTVDLKLLVPLTFCGIGVWQVLRRGLGISQAPGYMFIWYSFDLFWKFHHESVRANRHDGADTE